MLLFQIFGYSVREIDKVLIGSLIGPAFLGMYTLVIKAIFIPAVQFSGALSDYLFPRMSSLQKDPEGIKKVYSSSVSVVVHWVVPALFTITLSFYFYAISLLGNQWSGVERIAPMVAVSAACQAYISPAGPVIKAIGRPSWLLWWSVVFTILIIIGIFGGQKFGLEGVAMGVSIAYLLGVIVISLMMNRLIDASVMFPVIFFLVTLVAIAAGVLVQSLVSESHTNIFGLGGFISILFGLIIWKCTSLIEMIDITHFYKHK